MSSMNKYFDISRITHAKFARIRLPFGLSTLIVTWFYIGRIPIASGTLGSIGFYPIFYWALSSSVSRAEVTSFLIISTIVLFILGLWAISKFQALTNTFDHSYVVIDEIVGMSLTLALSFEWLYPIAKHLSASLSLAPKDITFILALLAFRFYDIKKPFFIGMVDKTIKTPFGVLLDDILAAIFAALTIYIAFNLYAFIRY